MDKSLTEWLPRKRLEALLDRAGSCRVGVVGDLALDGYWTADMTRAFLSRETPRFPRPVVAERYSPGAGGNVAQNLSALGVREVTVFSVLGDDWRGTILRREMAARGITVDRLVISPNRSTSTYIKPILTGYESEQEDARLDFENAQPLTPDLEDALIASVAEALGELDALLVADQLEINGVVTDRVREALIDLAATHPETVFVVDSRSRVGRFRHMVVKPNWAEASAAILPDRGSSPARPESIDAVEKVARALAEQTERAACVTLSAQGVVVWAEGAAAHVPAAPVTPPLDPVGAGDTFGAALATALACGATPPEAAAFANLAAAVIVEKLGQTGTATPEEIRARHEQILPSGLLTPSAARNPEGRVARDPEGIDNPPDWLEVVNPSVRVGHVRHALFDFDGTISVIRRGWEQVMIPLMVEMICDGHPTPPGLEAEVADYVDRSTGILTIKQMRWLEETVRRYGLAAEVKSAREYKRIYNERLLQPVRRRLARLDGSQAARDSLAIAGARRILEGLHTQGVRLYLASGTDHVYVVEEAEALGVADLFEGRIYGARDGAEAYDKARIIEDILTENDLRGEELLVVGDGPVEIRHARARDAVALGVAADEERRLGLNARKRERLLSAGADLIVTDFVHHAELVDLLTSDV